MRRGSSLAGTTLLLVAALLAPSPVSANAVKLGATCPVAGKKATVQGVQIVCAKVGARLVWRKRTPGAQNPRQQPRPPLADVNEAGPGLGCFFEGQEAYTLSGPLRCVKAVWIAIPETDDSVASRAYRSVLQRYLAGSPQTSALTFRIDPSSDAPFALIENGMRAAQRLWGVAPPAGVDYPVLIGRSSAWIRTESQRLGLPESPWTFEGMERQERLWGSCSSAGFDGFDDKKWYWYCYGGTAESLKNDAGFLQVGAHEYTHLAQQIFAARLGKPWQGPVAAPWFDEGFAMFVGVSLGSASGAGNNVRDLELRFLRDVTTPLSDYSEEFPAQWSDVYPMGMLAAEGLTALYGIDIMERVLVRVAQGERFSDALAAVTGKSLGAWTRLLQGYIDSVRAGKPWTLAELKAQADRSG